MADWKEMYLTMVRASEKALRILEEAQQECEEMYMRDGDEEAEREEAEREAADRVDFDDYEPAEDCGDEKEYEPEKPDGEQKPE